MRFAMSTVTLAVFALTTACSGEQTLPDAADLLALTQTAMEEATSYRFTGDWVTDSAIEGIGILRISGEVASPARFRVVTKRSTGPLPFTGETRVVDGQVYLWTSGSPGGPRWSLSEMPVQAGALFGRMLPRLESPTVRDGGVVSGSAVFVVSGLAATEHPDEVRDSFVSFPRVVWDFYVNKETYRLVRMFSDTDFGALPATDAEANRRVTRLMTQQITIDFFDYDEPIIIDLPEGFE